MASPSIFSGRRTKLLTADPILKSDGSIMDNDGTPNLIKNGHAEVNATGWVVSKNTSAASRPDSGFVTSSTNITWTRNITNPIDGQADFLYTKDAANRQGEQVYYPFTVSKKYRAKVLQVEVDYLVNSGTFVAGSSSSDSDVIIYIYDVTNGVFIEPSSIKLLSNSSTIADKFVANFQTSATGSSYRILFHQASTSASAFAVQFKDVKVAPCNYIYGTPITDWQSYTPTITGFGTPSNVAFSYRQVGDSYDIRGFFTSGTSTGVTASVSLPNSRTASSTKLTGAFTYIGGVGALSTTGDIIIPQTIGGSSNITFGRQGASSTGLNQFNGDQVATSTQNVSFTISGIPITGLSSSSQVSDGYSPRDIVGKFTTPSGAPQTSLTTVNFGTTSFDSTASYSAGTFTIQSSGYYKIFTNISINGATIHLGDYLEINIRRSGSVIAKTSYRAVGNYTFSGPASVTEYFTAGQTVDVQVTTSGVTTPSWTSGENVFTIEKSQAPTTMSATEVVAASYTTAAGQSISNSTTDIIDFGTKDFDTHNAVTTGASWKFTAPVSGLYDISSTILFASSAVTQGNAIDFQVFKNGSVAKRLAYKTIETTFSNFIGQQGSAMVSLNAGDYIDIRVSFNRTGGNTNLHNSSTYNHVNIKRIK